MRSRLAALPAALACIASLSLRHRCEQKPSLSFRQVIIHSTEAKGRFLITKAYKSGQTNGYRAGKGKGYGKGKGDGYDLGLAAARL